MRNDLAELCDAVIERRLEQLASQGPRGVARRDAVLKLIEMEPKTAEIVDLIAALLAAPDEPDLSVN
jgi:hypothetical protein